MYVAAGDRTAVLAAFDEWGAAIFASLCRLTAGDAPCALESLVRTFDHLRSASEPTGVEVDRTWLLAAAHSVYLVTNDASTAAPRAAVGSLSPTERVALDLVQVEGLGLSVAATVLDVSDDRVSELVAAAVARLSTLAEGVSAASAMRACEVWFDDATRARARAAVRDGSPLGGAAVATPTPLDLGASLGVGPSSPPYLIPIGSPLSGLPTRQSIQPAGLPEFRRPKRSRWVVIGAGIATAAVLGIAAVWVSPSASSGHGSTLPTELPPRTTTKPSTTTAPATTEPATTAVRADGTASTDTSSPGDVVVTSGSLVLGLVQSTGYIASPLPDGFAITDAYSNQSQDFSPPGWLQVWASPGATWSSGRWFAMVTASVQYEGFGGEPVGSQRVDIAGHKALVSIEPGGVQWTTVEIATGGGAGTPSIVEFESRGLTNEVIAQLVRSASTDSVGITFSAAADAALRGLDLRVSRSTQSSSLRWDLSTTQTFLVDYADPILGRQFQLFVTPQTVNDLEMSLLIHPAPTEQAATAFPDRHVELGDRSVIIGALDQGSDSNPPFVQWHEGTNTVSVIGYGASLDVLLEVARTARLATTDEWSAAVHTPPALTPSNGFSESTDGASTVIGDQKTSTGVRVITSLDPTGQGKINVDDTEPSGVESSGGLIVSLRDSGSLDHVSTFQSLAATLLIYATETPSSGVAMRVTIDGYEPVDTPLVAVGSYTAGSYVFSELGHFWVAIVDAAGAVVTQLVP